MNKNDYVFLKYCSLYVDNIFLDKLIEKFERGISLLEKKRIQNFVESQKEIKEVNKALFIYVLFKRTKKDSYVDELVKELFKDFKDTTQKELWEYYKWTQGLLADMELPELQASKQVHTNIKFLYG